MAEDKPRARSMKLPALQVEALRVMGVDVPWIVSASEQKLETESVISEAQHANAVVLPRANQDSATTITAPRVRQSPSLSEAVASGDAMKPSVASMLAAAVPDEPEAPVAMDVSGMDLEQLATCVRDCQTCGLSLSRKNAVPGQGVLQPTVMVVGEAPGEQEDIQGLPFVGPSGQLLDNMLASIGLSRSENVYIANTIKCRPPGNRNPRDEEIQSCMPYLQRQIELLQPQVILAVGLFASQTLLKSTSGVQALRAQTHQIQVAGRDIPVVVTYHPAYLLRRPADKRLAWRDLKQVWTLLQH